MTAAFTNSFANSLTNSLTGHRTGRARRRLAIACVLLWPTLWLFPCLVGVRTFVPFDVAQFPPVATLLTEAQLQDVTAHSNMDVTEVPLVFLPEWRFTKQELAAGRLPEWNPTARGGAPLLATSVVGLLYPPNWLLLLFPDPQDGLGLVTWIALAIGGLLALGFLRALGRSWFAATFGATAFQLSGTIYANAHFYQRLDVLVWLPGLLWATLAIDRARTRRRATVGLAVAVTMTWLAGFPPYAAPCTLVAGAFGTWLVLRAWRRHGGAAAGRRLLALGVGCGLGFGIAMVQFLPMLAFFPESNRPLAPSPDAQALQTCGPYTLLGYLFPDLFGHPGAQLPYPNSPLAWGLDTRASWIDGRPFVPNYNFTEHTVFPGTLVLLLAFAGALGRGRLRFVLLALLGTSWLLAIGPAWSASVHRLPGIQSVPASRFLGPTCLLVAALAALGIERWRRERWPRRLLVVGVALLLAGAALATRAWFADRGLFERIAPGVLARFQGRLPNATAEVVREVLLPYVAMAHQRLQENLLYAGVAFALGAAALVALALARGRVVPLVGLGVLGLTAVQLLCHAHGVAAGRKLPFAHRTAVHEFLAARRAEAGERGGFTVARARAATNPNTLPGQLPPCTLVPERIRDLNIYTFVDSRSHLPWHKLVGPDAMVREFWVPALPDTDVLRLPYLDLLGVRYLLSTEPLANAGTRVGPELRGPHGEFFVYERPQPLPRAFVVCPTVPVHGPPEPRTLDEVIARLVARDFDPRSSIVRGPDDPGDLVPRVEDERRGVRFVTDLPTEIRLAIEPGPMGYLVVSDTFMSGWTATVNGAPTGIARGNLTMRVVPIMDDGPVEVVMRYRTPRLTVGFLVTLASLLALLALWRFKPPRSRRRNTEA